MKLGGGWWGWLNAEMKAGRRCLSVFVWILVLGALPAAGRAAVDYEADVRVALDEIEKECGHFFELKKIDWDAVRSDFLAAAKEVKSDQDHLVLLVRLLARLRDGHAKVEPRDKGKDVKWPDP